MTHVVGHLIERNTYKHIKSPEPVISTALIFALNVKNYL